MFRSPAQAVRLVALTGAAIVALAAHPAFAANTAELGVSATVADTCSVTTTAVAFGTVDVTLNANVDAEGAFSVTCTTGSIWTASADAGEATDAVVTARKMTSGANLMNYALYAETGRTTNFVSATGTGTGGAQSTTVYGRVPGGQSALPAGAYADSVTISVTY